MLTLVGLAVLDWRFLMAALLAVPIQVLTARWYLACSTPLYAEQRVVGGVQQQLLDTVGGVVTVRAFGLSGGHAERVRSRSQDVVDLALGVVRLQTRFFGRLNLAEFVGVAAVLTAGFFLVAAGPRRSARPARRRCTSSTCSLRSNQLLFLLDTAQSASASLVRIVGVAELPAEQQPEHPGAPGGRRGAHQGPRALLRRGPRGPSTVSTSNRPRDPGGPGGCQRGGQDHAGQTRRSSPSGPPSPPDRHRIESTEHTLLGLHAGLLVMHQQHREPVQSGRVCDLGETAPCEHCGSMPPKSGR